MDDAKMVQEITQLVVWSGFVLALIFGYVANKTNFCTMGAVSDVVNMGDWGRMRAWLLAIAIAILGTALLEYVGYLDPSKTIYTSARLPWLAMVVGGLTFGVGMTLASGCGQRTLVRLGGGNLKSLVVFIFIGYSALVTLRGIFGWFRVNVLEADAVTIHFDHLQTLPALLVGAGDPLGQLLVAAAISLAILIFVFASRDFRQSGDNILAGIVVGLVVVGGWYVTGKLGFIPEHPETLEPTYLGTNTKLAESMTFVAPLGYTMDLWAYWTDTSTTVTFAIATVFGVVIGSFLYSVFNRTFRWEYFTSPQDMLRHIIGAVLMGFGGVTAMGCTIGQGVTGISTLAIGSIIVFISIIIGAAATMKVQYYLMMREA